MSIEFAILKQQITTDKERLIARLSRNILHTSCGCVIWLGKEEKDGYCRINFRHNGKHKHVYVHRIFYTLMSREPIPLNMEIDHTCNNRACVRHLNLTSYSMNKRWRGRRGT